MAGTDEQRIREQIRNAETLARELSQKAANDRAAKAEMERQQQMAENLKYELKSRGIRP